MSSLHDLDEYPEDLEDLDFFDNIHTVSYKDKWKHVWIDWALYVKKILHEIHFPTEYRMSYIAFTWLCFILRPFLERKHAKSRAKEQIKVEIIVACGLRYLAGGKASDQKHIFGLSRTEVYCSIWYFVAAANKAPDL